MTTCVFCSIVAGTTPAHFVFEDPVCVAFLDVRPLFRGHTLVVPRAHRATLRDVAGTELRAPLRMCAARIVGGVRGALDAEGTFVALNDQSEPERPRTSMCTWSRVARATGFVGSSGRARSTRATKKPPASLRRSGGHSRPDETAPTFRRAAGGARPGGARARAWCGAHRRRRGHARSSPSGPRDAPRRDRARAHPPRRRRGRRGCVARARGARPRDGRAGQHRRSRAAGRGDDRRANGRWRAVQDPADAHRGVRSQDPRRRRADRARRRNVPRRVWSFARPHFAARARRTSRSSIRGPWAPDGFTCRSCSA